VSEKVAFKAHARLLTMLGEQLIKNERIALVELVKNAYDADATRVTVDFRGFGADFSVRSGSAIAITDNGTGMTEEVVRTAWMNPATPSKAITKARTPKTPLGRVLQGEKGIGRFATFKLGNQVSLVTRAIDTATETTLLVDISGLDESPESDGNRIDYFLDELAALLDVGVPQVFDGRQGTSDSHGTELEIRGLRAQWSDALVRDAFADLDRLQPQLWGSGTMSAVRADFEVVFLRDGADMLLGAERTEEFQAVLERAVLKVTNGRFDVTEQRFQFDIGDRHFDLSLDDSEITGLRRFREHFRNTDGSWGTPKCGSFGFEFFIFDFSVSAPAQHSLDSEEKGILKEHRIYLYRDGIRVYPYGDPKDDWLEVDAIRGTESARSMFSNDQSVGFITITQAGNPQLRDKTNREGLLETGSATRDFIVLIQTILSFLRAKPYEQYAAANRRVREKKLKEQRLDGHIQSLRNDFVLPKKALSHLDALEAALGAERELSAIQVARTEQLAGVGMSVETASHDLIAASGEALRTARQIVDALRLHDLMGDPVFGITTSLVKRLEFINARFKDVQGLFVSTRQKQTRLDIAQLTRRVRSIYDGLHQHEEIDFEIDDSFALNAVSTEASVLQCLINLVDNATYWLMSSVHRPRVLRAFALDDRTLVLTDNGPGVKAQDEPYIFEAFYSGKGETGKGLGLYIARQNGLRNGFTVELHRTGDARELPGATFVVRFAEIETK
jgi:signal transduction histidine kinase